MSKYKFLVQVTSKDSSQMQATMYILFSLCKNEKQGVDISMSIFIGGKMCRTCKNWWLCTESLSDDITEDVILWYCLTGIFIEMAISAQEKENAKSQSGFTDCLLCRGSIKCYMIVQFKH